MSHGFLLILFQMKKPIVRTHMRLEMTSRESPLGHETMDEAPWLSLMSSEETEEHTACVVVISPPSYPSPSHSPTLCSKYPFLYLIFRDKKPFFCLFYFMHSSRLSHRAPRSHSFPNPFVSAPCLCNSPPLQ